MVKNTRYSSKVENKKLARLPYMTERSAHKSRRRLANAPKNRSGSIAAGVVTSLGPS